MCSCLLAADGSTSKNGRGSKVGLLVRLLQRSPILPKLTLLTIPPGERGVLQRDKASGYQTHIYSFTRSKIGETILDSITTAVG